MVDYQQDAYKIAYLITKYPNHKLEDILSLLEMPQININAAIWKAVELSLIDEPEQGKIPVSYFELEDKLRIFDEYVTELVGIIHYAFKQLARKETDFEEFQLMTWCKGYANHNILIALNLLLDKGIIAKYSLLTKMLDNKSEEFMFYTLAENKDKEWGRKQFKIEKDVKTKSKKH